MATIWLGPWSGHAFPDAGHGEVVPLGRIPVWYEQPTTADQAPPVEVILDIPEQGIRPRQPVIASVGIANLGEAPLRLPMYPHPRNGTVHLVVAKPDGSITEPFDVEGCAADGTALDLPPGPTFSDGVVLQFDADGDYLFDQSGDYYIGAFVELEPEGGPPVWIASDILRLRMHGGDDAAAALLDAPQVRRLMELEGGLHLEGAVENLQAVEAMGAESEYSPLASYYLGVAYLQAGGNLCAQEISPEALSLGLDRLHAALDAFGAGQPFLRKRAAWWLTRCYQSLGDVGATAEMREIFAGTPLPFEAREASMIAP